MKKSIYGISLLFLALLWSCEKTSTPDPAQATEVQSSAPVETTVTKYLAGAKSFTSQLEDALISDVQLLAGQSINVGSVKIYQTDTDADLLFDAFKIVCDLTNGWEFQNVTNNVKFYLGADVPTDDTPGLFPNKFTVEGTHFETTFGFSQFGFECDPVNLFIAFHADVTNGTSTETAWGKGIRFQERGSWSMYYSFDLTDKTPPTASNVTTTIECKSDLQAADPSVITDEADNCSSPIVTFLSEETDGNSCPETITRTFKVEDAEGNSITVTQTIIIHDVTPPVLSGQGDTNARSFVCEPAFTAPTATDNCDSNPVISYVDTELKNSAGKVYYVNRTWTATDACGNESASVSQAFYLDVEGPWLATKGENTVIACSAPVEFTDPTFSDNSGNAPVVTVVGNDVVETNFDGNGSKATTRTWVATDLCGNTSEPVSQTIINYCEPITPEGWMPGAGTGWAFDPDLSTAFNTLSNKTSNNWGWTNKLSFGSESVFTLYVGAGQNVITKGMPVGSVKVNYTATTITVTYTVISACDITDAHVWVGTTMLPLNKQNKYISSPGQLGQNSGSISTTSYTFNIPNTFGTANIYVAAHANIIVK